MNNSLITKRNNKYIIKTIEINNNAETSQLFAVSHHQIYQTGSPNEYSILLSFGRSANSNLVGSNSGQVEPMTLKLILVKS